MKNFFGVLLGLTLSVSLWAESLSFDTKTFDPLQGKVHRANLGRTGVHKTSGAPTLSKILWSFKTGGVVRSSPVVVDGVVYVGSEDGKVYAIDAATGEKRWECDTGGPVSGSAAVVNGIVYIGSRAGKILALRTSDGSVVWEQKTEGRTASSPIVAYGTVIIGAGTKNSKDVWRTPGMAGPLMAFDAGTGRLIWKVEHGPLSVSGLATDGNRMYGSGESSYSVYNLADGKSKMVIATTQRYPWGHGVFDKGQAFYPLAVGGCIVLFDVSNGGDPVKKWITATWPDNATITMTLGGKGGYEIIGDIAVTDSLILAPCLDNQLYAFNRNDGKPAWTFPTDGHVMGSPSVAGETVYFGSWDKHLYAVGLDGKLRSKIKLGGRVNTSPWPGDGVVFAGCDDGNIYAIGD